MSFAYTSLEDLSLSTLHHAYLAEGTHHDGTALETWLSSHAGSIDVEHYTFSLLGIQEAHLLVENSVFAVGATKRVFVIYAERITPQAQNALLKLFEEPPIGLHFFLVLLSTEGVLPTLLSRVMRIALTPLSQKLFTYENFFVLPASERIEYLSKLFTTYEKEERSKQTVTQMLVKASEEYCTAFPLLHKPTALDALLRVRTYVHLDGASHKILCEYLALYV